MRVTISVVACVTVLCNVACYATADVSIDKSTVEARRAIVKGKIDKSHDLVVRIDRDEKPIEWRSTGQGNVFEVAIEASNKISLGGVKKGHGFIVTIKQGASKHVTNVALTSGDLVGTFIIRRKADLVTKDGALTFADIMLEDGKKLPVSVRLEPKIK